VNRVLCAVDLSDGSVELLQYANAIVHSYGGCLTVLHVVPTSDAQGMRLGELVDSVIEHLSLEVGAAGITGNRVRYEVESGEPARAIIARALAIRADTVVLGAHARREVEPLLMGPVTDAVVRCAPCDMLTVPRSGSHARHKRRGSTIVCGVDFSTQSIDALRATLGLAERMDGRVVLVHAIEWIAEVEPPDGVDFDVADFRTRLVYNAQQRLDALIADESLLDCKVRTTIAIGRSHRELLRIAAEKHADLIVVGHKGRGGAVSSFGSTVEQIVRAAPCPVLTVRSPHEGRSDAPDR
jgi:nucleotide-binding universal stress UspA family protein